MPRPEGPNLNGIVAKSGVLLVGESSTGKLFRVDPDTGIADEVDLGGEVLPAPDGLPGEWAGAAAVAAGCTG